MSRESLSWSVMKYDLKTGLDVLELPCLVKLAGDNRDGEHDDRGFFENTECKIQFEKRCCVCYVRARVVDLPDTEWFAHKKGAEFVKEHAQLAGTTFLIPLEYGGKVRLYDRSGGKQYSTVRELVEDFPRFIEATDDMVCASSNDSKPQVVHKGKVLELDRITKSTGTFRGQRETYLICRDNENDRELAFKYMAVVSFIKVQDRTRSSLKDFVEHLPLPQTVEFINVNPYDVISVDDDDARDLLLMLSGPVQLLGLQMEKYVVGQIKADGSTDCDNSIIAIPDEDHVLESVDVRLPCDNRYSYKVKHNSKCHYIDVSVADDQLDDCLHQKLYLRHDRDETPLVVRMDSSGGTAYDTTEPPDTPPLPEKSESKVLTTALSLSAVNAEQTPRRPLTRKRFFSANDIGRRNLSVCSGGEPRRGFKTYFSHFSLKMKSTASQILFGLDAFSGGLDQGLTEGPKRLLQRTESKTESTSLQGFTCYLGEDMDETSSERSDTKNMNGFTSYLNSEANDSELTMSGDKPIKPVSGETSTVLNNEPKASENTENEDHVIYAKVDKRKKMKNQKLSQCHLCSLCPLSSE